MSIEEKILKTKPREESGPKTSRKYQFQKDLSLFMIITDHSKRDDYLFLFDFHEDLIISGRSTEFHDLEFYQIKSKDKGGWTIQALTKESNKSSILGKLYTNLLVFEDKVKSLNFISNACFSFKKLKDGTDSVLKKEIKAKELNDDELMQCDECLKKELGIDETNFEDLYTFKVTTLSNTDSSTHCLGALSKLINEINPNNSINPELAYNQVSNEIKIKTNETVGDKSFNSISDLMELKGLSKKQFTEILGKAGLYKSTYEEWTSIQASLRDQVKFMELTKYGQAWRDMTARIIRESNSVPLRKLQNEIQDIIFENSLNYKDMKLVEIIDEVYSSLSETNFDEYFVKCLVIKELNEPSR